MRLPDGTVIMHAKTPYDPAKAHEYYLRTRKLKGRKKGAPTFTVRSAKGGTVTLTGKELVEQKAYAAKRVNAIKQKLADLNSKLNAAMRVAKEKKTKSTRESSKPPSAADKSQAARESKKYRDKHQQEIATKSKKTAAVAKKKPANVDPVVELETKIYKLKETLKAVVAKQRALSGATMNR